MTDLIIQSWSAVSLKRWRGTKKLLSAFRDVSIFQSKTTTPNSNSEGPNLVFPLRGPTYSVLAKVSQESR